ncbi:sulfotransferase domain-containing protein [Mycoplana dimorpha]|nr:sulfotransferase domain-containing protein [Mycoplana dimorpha]
MNQNKPLRLVMHVGPHKTATTYLQANFHHNAEPLLQRGWLYPAIGERVGIAHHDLSDRPDQFLRRDGSAYRDFLMVMQRADREGLNVLLSSEGFRRWRKPHFQAISALIGDRSLHVVYTLRDPLDTFYSFWAQKAGMGSAPSLPKWMERPLRNPSRTAYLNPLREISPVLSLPGVDYKVLLYDEIRKRQLDIYSYFLQIALDIHDLQPTQQPTNQRLPIELTEFIRLLSKESGFPTGKSNSRKALHIGQAMHYLFSPEEKARIVATMASSGAPARRSLTVPRQSDEFRTIEKRLLAVLRERMHPRPDSDSIFAPGTATFAYYDDEELRKVPAVQELLQSALRRTRTTYPPLAALNMGKRLLVTWRSLRKRVRF